MANATAAVSPLRRRMIDDMSRRNLSPATQRSCRHAVTKFSHHFGASPDRLGLEDAPHEFIRRCLLHSLPDGFHRIRHYGFLANGCRRARLAIIRQLLAAAKPVPSDAAAEPAKPLPRFDPTACPRCGGVLRITATLPRRRAGPSRPGRDTS